MNSLKQSIKGRIKNDYCRSVFVLRPRNYDPMHIRTLVQWKVNRQISLKGNLSKKFIVQICLFLRIYIHNTQIKLQRNSHKRWHYLLQEKVLQCFIVKLIFIVKLFFIYFEIIQHWHVIHLCTFFWFCALIKYIPLSLMDVARDRDENSTDPWLSLTVVNQSRWREVSRWNETSNKTIYVFLGGLNVFINVQ